MCSPSPLSFGPNSPKHVQPSFSYADILLGCSKIINTSNPAPIQPTSEPEFFSTLPPSHAAKVVDPISNFDDKVQSVNPLKLDFINNLDSFDDDVLLIPSEIMI